MRQLSEQVADFKNQYQSNVYERFVKDRSAFPFFLLLFFISPALALLSGMFNFKKRGAELIMVLFFSALGYSWIINPGMDSAAIVSSFENRYSIMSIKQFVNEIEIMFALQAKWNTAQDLYLHIISYVLKEFTQDGKWLMTVLGMVFGFFYVKNARLLYEERKVKWDLITLTLFVFFISWVGVVGINAPRNYTGGMLFFFGAYSYLKTDKPIYLLLVLICPFVHFMYAAITIPFFAYVILKDRKYLYLAILAVSLIATTGVSELEPILTSTEFTENKARAYAGGEDEPPSAFDRQGSFHVEYYRTAGAWAVMTIFFGAIFLGGYLKNKNHDRLQNGLAGTSILILSLSNFTTAVPAMSNRSFTYFGLFALAYLVRFFSQKETNNVYIRWIVYLCLPAIFLYLYTQYSRIGDFIDFRVLISPLFYPFIGDDPVSLKETLRILLDL